MKNEPDIRRYFIGNANVYLIAAKEGLILVDTGFPGHGAALLKRIRHDGFNPGDIRFIIITHVHHDHAGNAADVLEYAPNAKVVVHRSEAGLLEEGAAPIPAGTGPLTRFLIRFSPLVERRFTYPGVRADIKVDESLDIEGFPISLIHTPGHTKGSICVLAGEKTVITGDTCFNVFGFLNRSVFPLFANDIPALLISWNHLLETGRNKFFPGHGFPFSRAKLKSSLKRIRE